MRRMTSREEGGSRRHVTLLMVQVAVDYLLIRLAELWACEPTRSHIPALRRSSCCALLYTCVQEHATHVKSPVAPVACCCTHVNAVLQHTVRVVVHMSTQCCITLCHTADTSISTEVSCAEYRLFYRDLLQKRPMFLGSLLFVATPYLIRNCSKHIDSSTVSTVTVNPHSIWGSTKRNEFKLLQYTVQHRKDKHIDFFFLWLLLYRVYHDCESSLNLKLDKKKWIQVCTTRFVENSNSKVNSSYFVLWKNRFFSTSRMHESQICSSKITETRGFW